eukprot:7909655-Lingulodinium_polyedra.AAC.1
MSVSVVAKGSSNLANTYWLEPTPVPAPVQAPPSFSYPTYQFAPVPMAAGSQWDYGAPWAAEAQWADPWPAHDSGVNDMVYFT